MNRYFLSAAVLFAVAGVSVLITQPQGGAALAAVDPAPLGDLSALSAIVADTQKIAATGDLKAAEHRITDLETAWDDAEATMRPEDPTAWSNVDGLLLVGLGLYALVFESLAIATGVPYGRFGYSGVLGPPLLGLAPPAVLLAWTPLILGALAVTRRSWAAVVLLVVLDLVLDPAAVRLGFWRWDQPGVYYGVPLVNFLGWVVSGGLAVLALRRLPRPLPGLFARNLWLVVVFWTAVNAWSGQWVPVGVGVAAALVVGRDYGRER